MISSYQAAQDYMARARSKAKGRPMKSAGWRLFLQDDLYVVEAYGHEIGLFCPDNTFMFSLKGEEAYNIAQTLGSTIHRNLPFEWQRWKKKAYRVDHTGNINGYVFEHFAKPTNAPLVYPGLTFDLSTGQCLNYKPDPKPVIDPDRRKEWLRASRAWKRKLKAAARVGVFDGMIAQEKADRTSWPNRPDWSGEKELDILYKAIKDGDCSTDLLRMFVQSEVPSWTTPTSMEMYDSIERIVKAQSVELRKRFGVFKEE